MVKRNEDLVAGDVVRIWGANPWYVIASIEPYEGPLADVVFAIAKFKPGNGPLTGFSLEREGYTEVAA